MHRGVSTSPRCQAPSSPPTDHHSTKHTGTRISETATNGASGGLPWGLGLCGRHTQSVCVTGMWQSAHTPRRAATASHRNSPQNENRPCFLGSYRLNRLRPLMGRAAGTDTKQALRGGEPNRFSRLRMPSGRGAGNVLRTILSLDSRTISLTTASSLRSDVMLWRVVEKVGLSPPKSTVISVRSLKSVPDLTRRTPLISSTTYLHRPCPRRCQQHTTGGVPRCVRACWQAYRSWGHCRGRGSGVDTAQHANQAAVLRTSGRARLG